MDMSADEIYEKVLSKGIFEYGLDQGLKRGMEKGLEQGVKRGEFGMAIKIKNYLGIDEAVRISGFSREELEKESLYG